MFSSAGVIGVSNESNPPVVLGFRVCGMGLGLENVRELVVGVQGKH